MKIKAASSRFALVSGIIFFMGCSPGMFFGGKDQRVLETPNYRRLNEACAGIDLSSSTLDVPKFREILHCFNSNGAIEPIEKLFGGMSDGALQPLVSGANKYLLNDKKKLYQIDRTYSSLESLGVADRLFFQLGRVLENDELISSLIAILRKGYFGPYGQDILQSIELISRDLTDETLGFAIDLGSGVTSAKSFGDLRESFSKAIPFSVRSPVFQDLVKELFEYLKEDHTYLCGEQNVPVSRELIQSTLVGDGGSKGDLFSALDEVLGVNEAQVKKNILPMVDVFRTTLSLHGAGDSVSLMEKLALGLRDLQAPVHCMDAAKSIPNASLHLIRELAELPDSSDVDIAAKYILRDTPLNFMSLGPFCQYPASLKEHYSAMSEFAKTGAIDPFARLLKAFSRVTRPWKGCDNAQNVSGENYNSLLYWLANFLADIGSSTDPAARTGIHRLIPSLMEITSRDAWADLLLVATLPTPEHQQRMRASAQCLLKPRAELRKQSIYDVLMKVIPDNNFSDVFRLAVGVQNFVKDPEPLLEPSFRALRQALYVNDAHPFLGLIRQALSQATHEKVLYDAIFNVSTKPEFMDSIRLLSSMGKDGRLKELVGASVNLFHKFAEEAKKDLVILETAEPAPLALRHPWVRADLSKSPHRPITAETLWYSPNCGELDVSFSLDQTDSAAFDVQLNHYIQCQNGAGADNDVSNAIHFLSSQKAENGQSFLKYQIDQTKKLILTPDDPANKLNPLEINSLLDSWMASIDDGRFFHFLDAVPYWIAPKNASLVSSQAVDTSGVGQLIRPLLNVSKEVITRVRTDLNELEKYVAQVIVQKDFPKLLRDMDDLLTPDLSVQAKGVSIQATAEVLPPVLSSFDRNQIRKWVESKECGHLSNESGVRYRQIEKRVDEILNEARSSITNWDLVQVSNEKEASPRQSWDFKELKELLNPLFDKFADREKQSVPHKWVLGAFLNFTGYFAMPPDGQYQSVEEKTRYHYQPQYLLEWLYDRAIDYRLITYFYPGEDAPRVRLVNTLDLLELTLVNVDFVAPFPVSKNMGLDFLSELADAWGDEPREMWPSEIQKQYPESGPENNSRNIANSNQVPRTLIAAVEDILDRPGFPGLDNLKKLTYQFVGLPVLPACHKDLPGLQPDIQAQASSGWVNALIMSAAEKAKIQRNLYNLWQVKEVLRETAANQGMKVLRDLFYEIKYSTPEKYRTPKSGDLNNLSVVLKTVRLGLLRQAGRLVQKFEKTDPALRDFFQALVHSGTSPNMLPVVHEILNSDREHKLVWKIIQQIFDVIKPRESGEAAHSVDLANMKQMVFYFIAGANRIDEWVPSHGGRVHADLIDGLLWRTYESLKDYREFWIKPEVDLLGDVLTSKMLSSFARGFYEETNPERIGRLRKQLSDFIKDMSGDRGYSRVHNVLEIFKTIYENDRSRESLKEFRTSLDTVLGLDEYKKLELEQSFRPILRFFEERGGDENTPIRPQDILLAEKLRNSLGSILKDHSLDQLLILERDNPESFYQLLETLSRLSTGDHTAGLKNFFMMLRRSLSEKPY